MIEFGRGNGPVAGNLLSATLPHKTSLVVTVGYMRGLEHSEPAHEYCSRRNRKPYAQSRVIDEGSRLDRLFLCRTTDAGAAVPCDEHIVRRQIKR